ncbi:MAG: hypothetical protein Q4D57_00235 [Clostridia bacterium]|nr:hypothetical protein [Clostridia bacterium]
MSKAGEIAATVVTATTIGLCFAGAVAVAVLCPEATPQTPPKRVVVVKAPVAPIPGVPAYKVPTGPRIIHTHGETVRLPQGYAYEYVVYNGQHCNIVRQPNGQSYYIWGGRHYPVVYY